MAKKGRLILLIYTGVHEISHHLYLNMKNKKIEVPLFYWKLVIDRVNRKQILFIIFMNYRPTKREKQKFIEDYPCECKCKELNYNFAQEDSKGFTRCCSAIEFISFFRLVFEIDISNMLRNIEASNTQGAKQVELLPNHPNLLES